MNDKEKTQDKKRKRENLYLFILYLLSGIFFATSEFLPVGAKWFEVRRVCGVLCIVFFIVAITKTKKIMPRRKIDKEIDAQMAKQRERDQEILEAYRYHKEQEKKKLKLQEEEFLRRLNKSVEEQKKMAGNAETNNAHKNSFYDNYDEEKFRNIDCNDYDLYTTDMSWMEKKTREKPKSVLRRLADWALTETYFEKQSRYDEQEEEEKKRKRRQEEEDERERCLFDYENRY